MFVIPILYLRKANTYHWTRYALNDDFSFSCGHVFVIECHLDLICMWPLLSGTWQTNSRAVKEELECNWWAFIYLVGYHNNLPDIWCRLGWWATRLCVMNTECFWAIDMRYNASSAEVPSQHGSVMTWCMKLCKNIMDPTFWCKIKARHWN